MCVCVCVCVPYSCANLAFASSSPHSRPIDLASQRKLRATQAPDWGKKVCASAARARARTLVFLAQKQQVAPACFLAAKLRLAKRRRQKVASKGAGQRRGKSEANAIFESALTINKWRRALNDDCLWPTVWSPQSRTHSPRAGAANWEARKLVNAQVPHPAHWAAWRGLEAAIGGEQRKRSALVAQSLVAGN